MLNAVESTKTARHSSIRSLANVGCFSLSLCIIPKYGLSPFPSSFPYSSFSTIEYPRLIIELNGSVGGLFVLPVKKNAGLISSPSCPKYSLAAFPSYPISCSIPFELSTFSFIFCICLTTGYTSTSVSLEYLLKITI